MAPVLSEKAMKNYSAFTAILDKISHCELCYCEVLL